METALYARYSTLEQSEGDSESRQRKAALAWCQQHKTELQQVYFDKGVSGGKLKRPALDELLKDLKKFDHVLVEDIDRLSRLAPIECLKLVEEIVNSNINLISLRDNQTITKDNWQTTAVFLPLTLKAALANEERLKRVDRGKKAWQSKRENIQKKPLTAKAPYWLTLENGKWMLVSDIVIDIQQLFELASYGTGIYTILRTNKFSRKYPLTTVYDTLKNPAVLGHFTPHKTIDDGKSVIAGETIKDYYPPIIDESLFYLVQRKLKERRCSGNNTRKTTPVSLFSGLGKCKYCKGTMINYGTTKYRYFVCDAGYKYGSCITSTIPYESIETAFHWILQENAASYISDKPAISTDRLDGLVKRMKEVEELFHETPSKSLAKMIADLEIQVEEETKKIEARKGEKQIATGDLEEILDIMSKDMLGENRSKVKSFIKDLVSSMEFDTTNKTVLIAFKNGTTTTIQFTDRHCRYFRRDGGKELPCIIK